MPVPEASAGNTSHFPRTKGSAADGGAEDQWYVLIEDLIVLLRAQRLGILH